MCLSPIIFTTLCSANLTLLRLTASPQVTIQNVKLTEDHMTLTWLYKAQRLLRKKSAATHVSVVIFYQSNGGKESRYPPEGSLAADELEYLYRRVATTHDLNAILFPRSSENTVRCKAV